MYTLRLIWADNFRGMEAQDGRNSFHKGYEMSNISHRMLAIVLLLPIFAAACTLPASTTASPCNQELLDRFVSMPVDGDLTMGRLAVLAMEFEFQGYLIENSRWFIEEAGENRCMISFIIDLNSRPTEYFRFYVDTPSNRFYGDNPRAAELSAMYPDVTIP